MGSREPAFKMEEKAPEVKPPISDIRAIKIIPKTTEQLRRTASEMSDALLKTDLRAGPLRDALIEVKNGNIGAIKVDGAKGVYSMEVTLLGQPRLLTFKVEKDALTVMLSDRDKNSIQTLVQQGKNITIQ